MTTIENPALFSGPMVRAILSGQKNQTRRVIKPLAKGHPVLNLKEHGSSAGTEYTGRLDDPESWGFPFAEDGNDMALAWWTTLNPLGVPKKSDPHNVYGSRIWVRENLIVTGLGIGYAADINNEPDTFPLPDQPDHIIDFWNKWAAKSEDIGLLPVTVPSIFMPRWACRLELEITGSRAERLQNISAEDAINEGILRGDPMPQVPGSTGLIWHSGVDKYLDDPLYWTRDPVRAFRDLWEHINGKTSWLENPWLWVTNFTRVEPLNKEAAPCPA